MPDLLPELCKTETERQREGREFASVREGVMCQDSNDKIHKQMKRGLRALSRQPFFFARFLFFVHLLIYSLSPWPQISAGIRSAHRICHPLIVYTHIHDTYEHDRFRVNCGSAVRFVPDVSRLPHYRAPLVCVPAVIGGLPVWRHHNLKKK